MFTDSESKIQDAQIKKIQGTKFNVNIFDVLTGFI